MRPEAVAWERAAEVREAAEGWLRAGAIDTSAYDAIRNAHPDPCVTPSAVWRVLTAVIVTAIVLCTLGAVAVAVGMKSGAIAFSLLLLVLGVIALVVTERLEASPRSARRGAAGATAFWGGAFVLVGLWIFLSEDRSLGSERALQVTLLAGTLVWAASGWRWGSPLFAGLAAVSLFLFLGRLPLGRVLWVLIGVALVGLVARIPDEPGWAPSHRRSAMVLLVAGVAAVYGALNVYSLDAYLIEGFLKYTPSHPALPSWQLVLGAIATAALPPLILLWAWASRRVLLLDCGVVLLALSLVTLRHYVHLAPLWVVLTASGALLIVLALAVERALRYSPGGERSGFTADALFSDERRQRIFQTVPVIATFTPAAAPAAATEETGFAGRGGTFGGGGASDRF